MKTDGKIGRIGKIDTKPLAPTTKVFVRDGEVSVADLKPGSEVLCADGEYHKIK